ncbi:hypothetical protein H5410_056625, partial [Solanum commersonii]
EPRGDHASLWYNNWTQLGALHYLLSITYGSTEGYDDVHQIIKHDRWNISVMTELLNKETKDEELARHHQYMGKGYSIKNIFSIMEDVVSKNSYRRGLDILGFLTCLSPSLRLSDFRNLVLLFFLIKLFDGCALMQEVINATLMVLAKAEVKAFKDGLNHCVQNNLLPLMMEINSLIIKKILDGI